MALLPNMLVARIKYPRTRYFMKPVKSLYACLLLVSLCALSCTTAASASSRLFSRPERIPVKEQVEVLALVGDIALQEGKPKLHAHVVLGRRDGSACGGHLLEARVRPTLEVIVTESPAHLRREHDPVTGLALIRV